MKCDRVLSSLTTGGVVARWRARRHAARCERCAEIQIQLREIERQLAEAPPLTTAQRALWTAVGTEPAAAPRPRWMWAYPTALAAAAVLLAAIGLKLWGPRPDGGGAPPLIVKVTPKPPPSPVESSERARLADELLAQVDRIDRELVDLRRAGDLLDVRKDADALWERYAPRRPSTL